MSGIIRAYDIRGKYPEEIDVTFAEKATAGFVKVFQPKHVVLGRDMRHGSPPIYEAIAKTMSSMGVKVIKIGLVSRPMLLYITSKHEFDGGIIVTASHNPKEYAGLKFCEKNGAPVYFDNGLPEIEAKMEEPIEPVEVPGEIVEHDFLKDYLEFLQSRTEKINIKVVVDTSNGTTGFILKKLLPAIGVDATFINDTEDPDFPGHNPNPLKPEATEALGKKVVEVGAACGFVLDPDGDRIACVDEQGTSININHTSALICDHMLKEGEGVAYDAISSKIVPETVEAKGGNAFISKVGFAYMHATAVKNNVVFSAETSSHYAYKEMYYHDAGILTALKVMSILVKENAPMSTLMKKYQKYFNSGEINLRVSDVQEKIKKVEETFPNLPKDHLDGVSITDKDYWFNVRASNTEPLLRIRIEANTQEKLDEVKTQLLDLIGGKPE